MNTRAIAILLATTTSAAAGAKDIPITPENWQLNGKGAEIVEHAGRTAIKLNRGAAELKNMTLKNGIIEFDIWMQEERGFGGVYFRSDGQNGENFYLRPHLNGKPDGNQYQPVFNNNASWQIFHGNRYSFTTTYNYGNWINVKLAIKDDKMDIYLDSDTPSLHVEDLLLDGEDGKITFTGALTDFYFSNVSVTPTDDVNLKGEAKPLKELAAGQLTSFNVARTPVDSAAIEGKTMLDPNLLAGQEWQRLKVTETGAANLSEIAPVEKGKDTALVRLTVSSDKAQSIPIKYGFSDRVTVFVNGKAIVHEDDRYMSRDYRYLGTVGLFDTVFLPLHEGTNDIIFAVTEGFGGWAFLAAADNTPGVTIR